MERTIQMQFKTFGMSNVSQNNVQWKFPARASHHD